MKKPLYIHVHTLKKEQQRWLTVPYNFVLHKEFIRAVVAALPWGGGGGNRDYLLCHITLSSTSSFFWAAVAALPGNLEISSPFLFSISILIAPVTPL